METDKPKQNIGHGRPAVKLPANDAQHQWQGGYGQAASHNTKAKRAYLKAAREMYADIIEGIG